VVVALGGCIFNSISKGFKGVSNNQKKLRLRHLEKRQTALNSQWKTFAKRCDRCPF
jgi:hypothetical protein